MSTATYRNGREVETTTATPVAHERFDTVVTNVREYDGEVTLTQFWGVSGHQFTPITRTSYFEILGAQS